MRVFVGARTWRACGICRSLQWWMRYAKCSRENRNLVRDPFQASSFRSFSKMARLTHMSHNDFGCKTCACDGTTSGDVVSASRTVGVNPAGPQVRAVACGPDAWRRGWVTVAIDNCNGKLAPIRALNSRRINLLIKQRQHAWFCSNRIPVAESRRQQETGLFFTLNENC